jgi:hypothetical protein
MFEEHLQANVVFLLFLNPGVAKIVISPVPRQLGSPDIPFLRWLASINNRIPAESPHEKTIMHFPILMQERSVGSAWNNSSVTKDNNDFLFKDPAVSSTSFAIVKYWNIVPIYMRTQVSLSKLNVNRIFLTQVIFSQGKCPHTTRYEAVTLNEKQS